MTKNIAMDLYWRQINAGEWRRDEEKRLIEIYIFTWLSISWIIVPPTAIHSFFVPSFDFTHIHVRLHTHKHPILGKRKERKSDCVTRTFVTQYNQYTMKCLMLLHNISNSHSRSEANVKHKKTTIAHISYLIRTTIYHIFADFFLSLSFVIVVVSYVLLYIVSDCSNKSFFVCQTWTRMCFKCISFLHRIRKRLMFVMAVLQYTFMCFWNPQI